LGLMVRGQEKKTLHTLTLLSKVFMKNF